MNEAVTKTKLAELNAGDAFKIGKNNFIVLEQMDGKTAVISGELMAENQRFDRYTRNYNTSSLKKLIESVLQPVIEAAVGSENLIEHTVDLTSVDMQNEFGSCTCKVRPITFGEARKYNNLLVEKNLGDWYWTCTPWSTKDRGWSYSLAVVSPSGCIGSGNYNSNNGVRPFCILKSDLFVSKVEE